MLRRSERKITPAALPSDIRPTPLVKRQVRCEEVWEKGVETKPVDSYPIFMKPSKNCAIPVDGKFAYVSAPDNVEEIEKYIAGIEKITGPDGFRGKSGVFTWILYRTSGDSTLKFVSTPVRSVIELGTLHHALARATGAATVHGAGEMRKRDASKNEILINFQSGSFMHEWKLPETCTLGEMERFLLPKVRQMLKGMIVQTPRKSTFITDDMTPPTMEELSHYAAQGFKVCLYDDYGSCRKGRGTCEKPLEEVMKAGASGWVGVAYDGAQVAVDDPRATKWFNTRTYDSLTCKPGSEYIDNSSKRVPKGADVCAVGASRRKKSKTRKAKKGRKATRRRL